jgi:hypothetical protein
MKRFAILVLVLAGLTALFAGCGDDEGDAEAVRGSGNVVTQEMPFADFSAVEAANAFEVEITQSDTFAVTIRVDDNILDLLDVSKEGDTLRLRLERGVSLRGDVTLEAEITMPDLDGLELSGASKASVSGFRSSGRLDIDLSGASSLDGDLEAGETDIDASGASRVVLEGTATGLTIEGSGASSLDLADFTVDTAEVRLSGASDATVRAQERIDPVDVSGASRLRYLGDPSLGDVRTSGASTVDKIGD